MKLTFDKKLTKDIDAFIGVPVTLMYILNNSTEITVSLPINWKLDELPKILLSTFIERPHSIHITTIEIDKTTLN